MDRRYFLKSSGLALASFGFMAAAPDFLHQFAAAQTAAKAKKKILVTIFQRGAVDGLNVIVPHGDSAYYDQRKSIAIPKPNAKDGAIDLDGFFGLHPAMSSLEPFWKDKRFAVIDCVGSPDTTRSHFDAQDYMESGTPGLKSTPDGWLNRALQQMKDKEASPFRAIAMTQQLPRSLYGKAPTVAMANLSDFSLRAGVYTKSVSGGFESIYEQQASSTLGETGKETFEAVEFLKKAKPSSYAPENGAEYPNSKLGTALKQIAQMIKAGVGMEVAFAETTGWDTHVNEGSSRGQLANLLRDFSRSIAAFTTDLGKKMDDVLLLTMSEFGRTVRENGGRGTDHGHGNMMLAIGGNVKGGKVYADWKSLETKNLYEGRDLPITTDFRDVFAEVSAKHLNSKDLNAVFPKYSVSTSKFKNFLS